MKTTGDRRLGDHPIVVGVTVISGLIVLFFFITGYQNLPAFIKSFESTATPQTSAMQVTATQRTPIAAAQSTATLPPPAIAQITPTPKAQTLLQITATPLPEKVISNPCISPSLSDSLGTLAQKGYESRQILPTANEGWFILADKNYWSLVNTTKISSDLTNSLGVLTQKGYEARQVVATSDGGWFILANKNYWSIVKTMNAPTSLTNSLGVLAQKGYEARQIIINPDASWIVLANLNYWICGK